MYPFFVALHVLLCLFLMLIIMLQPGKGGDISAAFGGGGSSTMFGPRGPTGLLQRATTMVAVLFMGTTITLALYSHRGMLDNANVDEQLQRIEEEERQKRMQELAAPAGAEMDAPAPAPVEGEGEGEAAPAAPEAAPAGAEAREPMENPPAAGAP